MVAFNGSIFSSYCTVISVISIALNILFLVVTKLKRVEGFQEVLVFMRNIAVGYIIVSICILAIAPQTIITGSSVIQFPHGLSSHFDPLVLNGIASIGGGCYLYTVFNFTILFLYRYNVTCKTNVMSTIFSRRNISIFLITAAFFSLIQSILFYYSAVDSAYSMERLNRTKDIDDLDLQPQMETLLGYSAANQMQSMTQRPQTADDTQFQQQQQQQQQQHSQQSSNFDGSPVRMIGVFGWDYGRNPMIFLSIGIFTISNAICSVVILIVSLVVACKLRGRQDAMSDKSQEEHQKLTNVLILDAYLPVLMAGVPAVNFLVAVIRHESLLFQEYLGMLVLAPIPGLFPLINVFLVPALRSTAFQVLVCMYWRNKRTAIAKEKSDNAVGQQEDLNQAQVTAIKNMSRKV